MCNPTELPDFAEAVRKLVKAKGRFHTEQNYKELADALARHDAHHAEPSPRTAPEATRQDLRDVFGLAWNQALADAALYVASHCALEEHHVERILELAPPKLRVRGVEITNCPAETGALTPEADVRTAFMEWHMEAFGYCFDDEKSFTDGGLQAVAWSAWQEAQSRSVRHAHPLPKTGITAAEVAAVLDDLERNCSHAVSTGIRAHTIIEGLLSGLDVGQLS